MRILKEDAMITLYYACSAEQVKSCIQANGADELEGYLWINIEGNKPIGPIALVFHNTAQEAFDYALHWGLENVYEAKFQQVASYVTCAISNDTTDLYFATKKVATLETAKKEAVNA